MERLFLSKSSELLMSRLVVFGRTFILNTGSIQAVSNVKIRVKHELLLQ